VCKISNLASSQSADGVYASDAAPAANIGRGDGSLFKLEAAMDTTTILIIVVVLLVLGGGGWYGRGRWY
jgi:hypothetical protein